MALPEAMRLRAPAADDGVVAEDPAGPAHVSYPRSLHPPRGFLLAGHRRLSAALKLGMTYPLVTDTVLEFAASVDEIVVIEEKRPFIETQLRAILHENGSAVPVLGKRDRVGRPLTSSVGELDARAAPPP